MSEFFQILNRAFVAIAFLFFVTFFASGVFVFIRGIFTFSGEDVFASLALMLVTPPVYFTLTRGLRWILTGKKTNASEFQSFFQFSAIKTSFWRSVEISKRIASSILSFFANLNTIVPKTYRGEYSLGNTYWVGVVLCGGLVALGIIIPIAFLAMKLAFKFPVLAESLVYGAVFLSLAYQLFFLIAVNNSASNKRNRGFWGWLAIIFLALGLLQGIWQSTAIIGLRDSSWSEFEDGVHIENLGLPTKIDEVTTLNRIATERKSKSIIYEFDVDLKDIDQRDFSFVKEGICGEAQSLFDAGVLVLIYRYTGVDSSFNSVQHSVDECIYQIDDEK